MKPPVLSAVVIAFEEEHNIGRCLDSLRGIADEVVVVDSGSSDRTVELAKASGARVLHHSFEGHIQQKNWAAAQARGEWILSLDADEALSPELQATLLAWKSGNPPNDVYAMNRLTSYCGQWVRQGGWYPDRKMRLWKSGAARWAGTNPHDRLEPIENGPVGHLKGDLLHYSYHTEADHFRQIRLFSDIAAVEYTGPFWLTHPVIRVIKSAFQWTKNALIRGGWRDGKTGWMIAKRSAFATAEKYRKARLFRRKQMKLQAAGREKVRRVLISRTDAIGDVVLTLPLAGWLSEVAPEWEVDVLVRSYAAPAASASKYVRNVLIWDSAAVPDFGQYDAAILAYPDPEVARTLHRAGVPIRVGTGRRWPFSRWVNVRNHTSRKNSGKHETWHGLELLLELHPIPGWSKPGITVPEEYSNWVRWGALDAPQWDAVKEAIPGSDGWIVPGKQHVILHAGSNLSATNWSVRQYAALADLILKNQARIILTGTAQEAGPLNELVASLEGPEVVQTFGQLTLTQLMALIQKCDGLVASSTGPLHLAAGLGTPCVGLYGSQPPIWPERWHPNGSGCTWLVAEKVTQEGSLDIDPSAVWEALQDLWS